jgi:phenylacetate-CoA ligase
MNKKARVLQKIGQYQKYWNTERETMAKAQRDKIILERLKLQLEYAYNRLPFYRRHYDAHGFKPEMVKSLEDFTTKVPVIKKAMLVADQEKHPPFGSYLGVAPEQIARIHGSSGTSGKPTFYGVSRKDWERAADLIAMAFWSAGIRPSDTAQISFPFSLFFGGWGVLQGLEKLQARVFPLGMLETERHLRLMHQMKPTLLAATPSYALHMAVVARELGLSPEDSSIELLLVGGEPGGSLPSTRKVLAEAWGGAVVIDSGSTSEMYPFNTNCSTIEENGVMLYQDEVYAEIVIPDNPNEPVTMGQRGAIVYTHLWRESQPMLRFYPGDETFMTDEPCPSGRTYPRLPEGVIGRLDDMLIIRGVNIYPSTLEKAIREVAGSGLEFRLILEKKGVLDELSVQLEYDPQILTTISSDEPTATARLGETVEKSLKIATGIRIPVQVVRPETFERTTFKARRVIDKRK